jgi:predicted nucleotidyltransferase
MSMEQVWRCAAETEVLLRDRGMQYCFIGGLANYRWGKPRTTHDVDLTLLSDVRNERQIIDRILADFGTRRPDAVAFALAHRVLLLKDHTGFPVDISLGFMPYEVRMIDRATPWGTPQSAKVTTCSAEDLVVLKAFANRDRDWTDVRGVLVRQGKKLDRKLILEELAPLVELKEEPEILDRLVRLMESVAP